jgi:hypothetical protein
MFLLRCRSSSRSSSPCSARRADGDGAFEATPDLMLQDQTGKDVSSSDLAGKTYHLVLPE